MADIYLTTPNDNLENQVHYIDVNPSYIQEFWGELSGTYIFLLFSLGNIAQLVLYPTSGMTWVGVAACWGLSLYFGILASGLSGSHLNPAVTLTLAVLGKFSFLKVWYYMLAQLIGSFLSAATVYVIYYNRIENFGYNQSTASIFATYKFNSVSVGYAFLTELLGTALLVGGIVAITHTYNKIDKKLIPVYISLLLGAIVLSFGYQTAFSLNPARDLGPRLFTLLAGWESFSYENSYFWVPLTADFVGALLGGGLVEFVINLNN